MSESQNRAVIEDYYRAMREGDFAHVVGLHAPDLVCWMSGKSLVSGRFVGRDALYAHMGSHVLGALITGTEPYVKQSSIAIVDASMVVGVLHGGLPAKHGGRYDQYYLQIFRLQHGLIVEIVEMFDTVMVETALMKNHLNVPRPPCSRPFEIAGAGVPADPNATRSSRNEIIAMATRFLAALQERNPKQLRSTVDPSLRILTIGSTPLSGVAEGVEQLESVVDRGVRAARIICADGNVACALMRSSDPEYDQQYGLLIRIEYQRVVEVSIFLDTVEAEMVLYANPLLPNLSRSIMPPFDIEKVQLGSTHGSSI